MAVQGAGQNGEQFAALTGVVAALREDAALTRLRQAAQNLTSREASRLATQLRQLPGDENREAISVVREALEREPGEVAPAEARAGNAAEVSPFEHCDERR